jgi:hypothetical protein
LQVTVDNPDATHTATCAGHVVRNGTRYDGPGPPPASCHRRGGGRSPGCLEVFGLALVLAHSPSLVEAFGGPTPISLAEFRAGG